MISRLQYEYEGLSDIPKEIKATNLVYNIIISESEAKDLVFEIEEDIRDLIKDIVL